MRAPETSKPKTLRFNITPLIDVTFLLIVFFVMTSQMINDEVAMELTLPRETSGEAIEEDDKNKIVVNVESADVFYFGAKRVDVDELRERLLREKARATRETSVRIRANRDVPYGAIEPILILCAQTGFTDVSFAVVEN
ncbi:MAG: biopolymer transporter ExbD [Thermoguttaceae bacterium]|nr:biopolymer transporter ExbD [Thermoguttaceae bacterium]